MRVYHHAKLTVQWCKSADTSYFKYLDMVTGECEYSWDVICSIPKNFPGKKLACNDYCLISLLEDLKADYGQLLKQLTSQFILWSDVVHMLWTKQRKWWKHIEICNNIGSNILILTLVQCAVFGKLLHVTDITNRNKRWEISEILVSCGYDFLDHIVQALLNWCFADVLLSNYS